MEILKIVTNDIELLRLAGLILELHHIYSLQAHLAIRPYDGTILHYFTKLEINRWNTSGTCCKLALLDPKQETSLQPIQTILKV